MNIKAIPLYGIIDDNIDGNIDEPVDETVVTGGDNNTNTNASSELDVKNNDTSALSMSTFQKYQLVIGSIIGLTLIVFTIVSIVKLSKKK